MNKPTLVILAAGMGSRYGGLKQMDTFTKEGDTIIDFSLYDAIQAGFGKVVFVIRKTFEKDFKAIFDKKLEDKVEVDYVFQEVDKVPEKILHTATKRDNSVVKRFIMICSSFAAISILFILLSILLLLEFLL